MDDLQPDGELVNAIVRAAGGKLSAYRTTDDPDRSLCDINDFHNLTIDLIAAARQALVFGTE